MSSNLAVGLVTSAVAVGLVSACGSSSSTTATSPASGPTSSMSSGAPPHSPGPRSTAPSTPHATEFSPPGDIPDSAVYVDHVAPGSHVHLTVPEGWAQVTKGGVTTYTDKYNSISIQVLPLAHPPTPSSVRAHEVPQLSRTVTSFHLQGITRVTRQHGSAVHVVYGLDSAPNPVTNKVVRDVAERFDFWHAGQEAVLTLTGPSNADNVDPWQTVSDSLQWK
ncbi:hypothetical protein [Nocardioides cynanchi]|uniref:hypothetical protein n=1 Tax=Nocardioides cynanchi TaxID=2558918 RepID=UPI001782A59F|nr:hypothetical protein [Nocardioides cynanchi]